MENKEEKEKKIMYKKKARCNRSELFQSASSRTSRVAGAKGTASSNLCECVAQILQRDGLVQVHTEARFDAHLLVYSAREARHRNAYMTAREKHEQRKHEKINAQKKEEKKGRKVKNTHMDAQ